MVQMFKILSYFKRPDKLQRVSSVGKREKEKRVKKAKEAQGAGKERRAAPTLSGFVHAATRGVSRSTADNYRTAVNSFIGFSDGGDVPLSILDAETMRRYERWLHEQGVCPNTSSCYMRSLRAIYNKAVAKRLVKDKTPFKHVFTGNEKTIKRSIGVKEIRKLCRSSIPPCGEHVEETLSLPLDLFLFSFYAMGMPFVDLAHLRKSQIKNGMLAYRRHKTGKQIKVKLEKCMLDILEKYKAEGTDYLFPILYKVKDGKIQSVSYPCALNRYNRSLKLLARQAGISINLTSYVVRHSWASIAYHSNIDLPVISKALGHAETKTTLVYVSEIDDKRLATANRKLLREVLKPTSW